MENTLIEIAAVALGFLLRLGIPIGLTVLFSLLLRWLDKRWQTEAEAEAAAKISRAEELIAYTRPCWEIHKCPPRLRNACRAYADPNTPCWEIFRSNGQLKPACHNCKVLPPAMA
jgi:hypothetical protein